MHPVLYPRRRNLDHTSPWGVDFPEYFLTICCRKMGTNQLCQDGVGQKILEAAHHYHTTRRWHCELMVLMPDHMHALVSPGGQTSIHEVVRFFKSWTAKHTKVVWQNGFFEHRLRNGTSAEQKWKYVNENPVRLGLILNPMDWPWRFAGRADRPDQPMVDSGVLGSFVPSADEDHRPYQNL